MRNEVIVGKMLGYCEKLIRCCEGYSYEAFSKNTKLVEACVFNLSRLGELCHAEDDDFAAAHTDIPWAEMCGLRNRIAHAIRAPSHARPGNYRRRYFGAEKAAVKPVKHNPQHCAPCYSVAMRCIREATDMLLINS